MKSFRKSIVGLCAAAILLAAVFLAGRYGWKALGFRACQGAGIESVTVGKNAVEIKGFYPYSFPEGFCGYYAEEQDGTLYVGFRFSAVFGSFETGDFDVTIPVKSEIREVILKTKTMETSIWIRENEVPDTSTDTPPALTLPILDEINERVTLGTSGSSLLATQAAVELLDAAGCADTEITWGSEAVEPVETIMGVSGLR